MNRMMVIENSLMIVAVIVFGPGAAPLVELAARQAISRLWRVLDVKTLRFSRSVRCMS